MAVKLDRRCKPLGVRGSRRRAARTRRSRSTTSAPTPEDATTSSACLLLAPVTIATCGAGTPAAAPAKVLPVMPGRRSKQHRGPGPDDGVLEIGDRDDVIVVPAARAEAAAAAPKPADAAGSRPRHAAVPALRRHRRDRSAAPSRRRSPERQHAPPIPPTPAAAAPLVPRRAGGAVTSVGGRERLGVPRQLVGQRRDRSASRGTRPGPPARPRSASAA